MRKLYLFNSDSDLALADFTEHYMAPALIRQMADELATLPVWYAEPGSGVLAASAYHLPFLQRMKEVFGLDVELVTWRELAEVGRDFEGVPWGWNPAVRRCLLRSGMGENLLPSVEQLAAQRGWAGRDTALQVLEEGCRAPYTCGSGEVLDSVSRCREYWYRQGQRCVFKSPWSGSGKGLLWCYSDFSASVEGWCRRVLAAQGRIIGMPLLNKVCDFAMEFYSDGCGGVRFSGYSFFETNAKGAYMGNWLASDERIEQRLEQYVPKVVLREIRDRVQHALACVYAAYGGCLGVDMMICRAASGEYSVCPCVEVNLRMNMGLVARVFADRYLPSSVEGVFRVEAFESPLALQQAHENDLTAYPAVTGGGKLQEGYWPLVPVTPKSRYRAFVRVSPVEKNRGK